MGVELNAPRAQRAAMLLRARCVNEAGEAFWITVRNLSNEGLGGVCTAVPPIWAGEALNLTIRGVRSIEARVAWIDDKRIGVAFERSFNPNRLDIKNWWLGPDFKVAEMHKIAETFYRPATKPRT